MSTKELVKRSARIGLGVFFVALGVIGLVLPLLQGILFILIGLALLSPDLPFLRWLRERLRRCFPRHRDKLRMMKQRLSSTWQRLFHARSQPR